MAHYLTRPAFVQAHLLPHLAVAWGGRWWLVIGLAVAGAGAGLLSSDAPLLRVIAIVALVGAVAYIFTPATAGGAQARCFGFNTRFAAPAIALGLIALPILFARRGLKPLVAVGAIVLAQITDVQEPHDARALLAALVLIAVGSACALGVWRRLPRPALVAAAVLAGVLVITAGWREERNYLTNRYRQPMLAEPVETIAAALAHVTGARIAVNGFNETYPLYGPALSNRVEVPVRRVGTTRFAPYTNCQSWLGALQRGHYDYVVTASETTTDSPAAKWTGRYPGATELLVSPAGTVRQGNPWRWQLFRTARQARFDPRAACATP